MKLNFRGVLATALVSSLVLAGSVSAQLKGLAEVSITAPSTKVVGKEVVTTFKLKNTSKQSIAGLKIEEYWYDKSGNPTPGATRTFNQPVAPGAIVNLELKTPRTDSMDKNNYIFSHANGKVKATVVKTLE
jgi:uncharacterized protein YcfL